MIRTRVLTVIAAAIVAVTAGTAGPGFADPPAAKPPADKPAADKPPADRPTVSDAQAQRFFAFFDKLVSIVVANQKDCAKMAAGINAHIDASAALLKEVDEAKSQNKQLPPAVKAKVEKKIKDELQPAIQSCVQDKGVQSAFERIDRPKADHPKGEAPKAEPPKK